MIAQVATASENSPIPLKHVINLLGSSAWVVLLLALQMTCDNAPVESPTYSDKRIAMFAQQLIQAADPLSRADAADRLGEAGSIARQAIPQLLQALDDPDIKVRDAADHNKPKLGLIDRFQIPSILDLCWSSGTNASATAPLVLADLRQEAFLALPVIAGLTTDSRGPVAENSRRAIKAIDPYSRWTGGAISRQSGSAWKAAKKYWITVQDDPKYPYARMVIEYMNTIEQSWGMPSP